MFEKSSGVMDVDGAAELVKFWLIHNNHNKIQPRKTREPLKYLYC